MWIVKIETTFPHYKDSDWNRDGLMVQFCKISPGLASRKVNLLRFISSSSPVIAMNTLLIPSTMLSMPAWSGSKVYTGIRLYLFPPGGLFPRQDHIQDRWSLFDDSAGFAQLFHWTWIQVRSSVDNHNLTSPMQPFLLHLTISRRLALLPLWPLWLI